MDHVEDAWRLAAIDGDRTWGGPRPLPLQPTAKVLRKLLDLVRLMRLGEELREREGALEPRDAADLLLGPAWGLADFGRTGGCGWASGLRCPRGRSAGVSFCDSHRRHGLLAKRTSPESKSDRQPDQEGASGQAQIGDGASGPPGHAMRW